MLLAVLILTAAVVTAALWLHHIFEGEWLPHDVMRERKLARTDLADLDKAWAAQSDRARIIITLTTTPSRIGLLQHTLKSLLDQIRPPEKIILNVPHHSIREGRAYTIPPELAVLQALEIRRTEDLGPGTKLLPTLQDAAPNQALLAVDDDRIYPNWLVAHYEAASLAYNDEALTLGGWVVPSDLEDRPTTIRSSWRMEPPAPIRAPRLRSPRQVDVMLGVFSYLVRPRFFDLDEVLRFDGPPELRYVDDVRTSALCNVPKLVLPARSLSFVPWRQRAAFQSSRLGLFNRGQDGGARHNTIAIQHYRDRWRVGGDKSTNRPKGS